MRNSGRLKLGYFPLRTEEGTCSRSGGIVASNPCSEYMFLDDSARQPGLTQPASLVHRGRIKYFDNLKRVVLLIEE